MNTLSYKTISANKETVKKEWVVIDATDMVVGRLCSIVAKILRGKYKPNYTGYPGGQRFNTPEGLRKRPNGVDRILRHAVKGMLPKGPLGRAILKNLYVFEGTEHNKEAQKPKAIDIKQYK